MQHQTPTGKLNRPEINAWRSPIWYVVSGPDHHEAIRLRFVLGIHPGPEANLAMLLLNRENNRPAFGSLR